MYSFDSKIRYSEVDMNCNADLCTIINYFQDCSCFQSEHLGVGVKFSIEHGCAWLLNSWQINIKRFPKYAEDIVTGTWAYGFDRVYGYRNFIMKTKEGEVLAVANSNWIYVDIQAARPLKLTSDITDVYPIEPKYENMTYQNHKVGMPANYITYDAIPVRIDQIDSNQHMNNEQYIKIAQGYLPNDFKIWQMRAEYKRQALYGDLIIPQVTRSENMCTIALVNEDAKPYCVIEFTSKAGIEKNQV